MKPTMVGRWMLSASACLFLLSCTDDDAVQSQPRVLSIVSGNHQAGKAGQEFGEAFIVRATNILGQGVGGVAVTWTVTSGEGAFEDGFDMLNGDGCAPIFTQTTRTTDSDGFAGLRFMPTSFGAVTVTARAAGVSEQATFMTDTSDSGALLTIVAGNNHEGKAGETSDFDPGSTLWAGHHFEVRVLDGQGDPVPHVAVRWGITSGDVGMGGCTPAGLQHGPSTWTRTRSDGIAVASYRLVALGPSTVAAAVPGVLVSPVTFTVTATGVVIVLGNPAGAGPTFFGPDHSPDLTVPVGTPVEWMNGFETARIVSTATPPGGTPFDTGDLTRGERYAFVPDVAGTWEYVDQVSGASGTLTAR